MAKDFSAFLGPKKKKNLDLLGADTSPRRKAKNKEDRRENVEISQRKRSEQHGENVEISQRKRSESSNSKQTQNSKRRDKGGENVEISQRKRSEQHGENVEIKIASSGVNPTLLVGTQRAVFTYLVELAQSYASLTTPPLTLDALSIATELKSSQIHTATKELRKKRCIAIDQRKDGRGGWVSYRVEKEAYEKWIRLNNKHIRRENVEISQRKRSEQPRDKGGDQASSSSSYFNNNSTTTSDELWKTLDLSSVETFGINQSAIFEARQKFGPFSFVDFEKFLERFGKFMSDGKKSKSIGNARGFFFSLCKQIREGIDPLSEIKTDSDEALALLLKLKKEEKRKREEVERELMSFEFDEWFDGLSDKQKDTISPPTELLKKGSGPYRAVFRNHFEENLWPQIKSKMVQGEL